MQNWAVALGVLSVSLFTHFTFAQVSDISSPLTDAQKVGQMMIWSVDETSLTPYLDQTFSKYQPGAVIFFRRNIRSLAQVARFNAQLQTLASRRGGAPLFTMIDQEGGQVIRIRTAVPLPSALALGRVDDPALVRQFAAQSAAVLKSLGFNVNLAPVLDVSNPVRRSFIGNRTFGNDPARVATLSEAFALGLSDAGMMATAKHFPGHGDTVQNSHRETPTRPTTLGQLRTRDLVPFAAFAHANRPRAVMMAHLSLPNVDPSGLPATFSTKMIEGELRERLGYRGLVITDDLEMLGAGVSRDVGERAVRAVQAGNDMVMISGSRAHQVRAFEAVLAAVRGGRVSRARLDQSVGRILAAKAHLTPAEPFQISKVVPALRRLDQISSLILRRNFDDANLHARHAWPSFSKSRVVHVLSGSSLFFRKFSAAYPGSSRSENLTKANLDQVSRGLERNDEFAVYFASGQISARWLNTLSPNQKAHLIVINCNDPAQVRDQDAFMSVFNLNSYSTDGATWLARELGPRPRALTVTSTAR